ncbi:MAG: hypothetical protein LBU32_20030 [Clostridiales bacterium]|jgi:hypothetical protein|nr:hypothetical protein [Clostridiales bacterium]
MGNGEVHEFFRVPAVTLIVLATPEFIEMILGVDLSRYYQNACIMRRADLGELFDCASNEPTDGEYLLKDSAGYVFARYAIVSHLLVEGGHPDMQDQPAFEVKPRPGDWKRIVEDSSFNLVEVSAGEESSYLYGSYPCIGGSTVLEPLAIEFARQHLDDRALAGFTVFSKTHDAFVNFIEKQPRALDWNGGVEVDNSVDLVLLFLSTPLGSIVIDAMAD